MPTSHLVVIQWWSCFLPWAYGIKNRQDGSLQWTSPSPQALKVTVSPKPMLGPWSVLIFREMLSLLASNPLESLLSATVSEVFLERSCVDLFWVEELLLVKKSHHPMPPIHYPVTPSIVWFGDEGSLWREIWTPWWLLFFFFFTISTDCIEFSWTRLNWQRSEFNWIAGLFANRLLFVALSFGVGFFCCVIITQGCFVYLIYFKT